MLLSTHALCRRTMMLFENDPGGDAIGDTRDRQTAARGGEREDPAAEPQARVRRHMCP